MNSKECNDKNCPTHGTIKMRGRTFKGKIVSTKAHKSAIVEWTRLRFVRKYERYEKRRTRMQVHNPICMSMDEGDYVEIKECRPLSKTKKFVIIKKVDKTEKKIELKQEKKSIKKTTNKKQSKNKK